jgi:hypothetical protein
MRPGPACVSVRPSEGWKVPLMSVLPETWATPVLRTDFSDRESWEAVRAVIASPNDNGFKANAEFVDNPACRDLTTREVFALVPADHRYRLLAVVDETTIGSGEMPLLVIDLQERPPREIRVIATEFWSIENNLTLGNMNFEDFAGTVHADGIFRGF